MKEHMHCKYCKKSIQKNILFYDKLVCNDCAFKLLIQKINGLDKLEDENLSLKTEIKQLKEEASQNWFKYVYELMKNKENKSGKKEKRSN